MSNLICVRFLEAVEDFSKGAVQEMVYEMAQNYILDNVAEQITKEEFDKICLTKQFDTFEKLSKKKEKEKKEDEIYNLLTNSDLFNILDKELDKKIVDEYEARQTLLLIALGGKLTINCSPTSKNLMVNDEAGAGKDYLTQQVLKLLPKEDVIARKRISPTVFTYWHNAYKEPEWNWDNKIFYNEDINNTLLHSDVFKVMSSSNGENISTITIDNNAREILVRGKPVMIITIATASPNPELLRRYPILNLDTTREQTKKILRRKALYHSQGIVPEYDTNIIKALEKLYSVKVKVPYAEELVNVLDDTHIIIRTHFDRFIDYIKFSAAIYQHQREKDEAGYILANGFDFEIGRMALLKTTTNVFSIPLTKNQQKIIDIIKLQNKDWLSVSDLITEIKFISQEKTLRKYLDKLSEYQFLEKDLMTREESNKPVMCYKLNPTQELNIPIWQDIQIKIL